MSERALADPTWPPLPVRSHGLPTPAERAAAVARMQAWARERGACFDALDLGVDAAGNSTVRARRPIELDEPIITIPRALILCDRDLPRGFEQADARETLATWVALEVERADSPWRPFLATWPVQFPDVPMYRGGDELAPLAGTSARLWAAETYAEILDTHARFDAPTRLRVSLAGYAWGRAIVRSRAFNAPHTVEPALAFIPIVDLMDHRWDETSWAYDPARAEYTVHAMRDFAPGEPVHFTYGGYGNAHLLVEYGFAVPDNPYDETVFDIDDELFMVTARQDDQRWADVRARLDDHGIVAAARRALTRLDAGEPSAAGAARDGSYWHEACVLVRRGERRALEAIIAAASARRA